MTHVTKLKDRRYAAVKILFETGSLRHFADIFEVLPRSILAADMGLNYGRFMRKIHDLKHFSLREIYHIADFVETDRDLVLRVIHRDAQQPPKARPVRGRKLS